LRLGWKSFLTQPNLPSLTVAITRTLVTTVSNPKTEPLQ
jgi:hypothetical protein